MRRLSPKKVISIFFGLVVLLGWMGGHYGFWPNWYVNTNDSFPEFDVKDPRFCREFFDPSKRFSCEGNSIHRLAHDFSPDDCKSIPARHFLERGYCLNEAVTADLYPRPNDCNLIVESFYRRSCHVHLLPAELFTLPGLVTILEVTLSLSFVVLLLYLLIGWFYARKQHYPSRKQRISWSFLIWFSVAGLAMINPFGLLSYHATAIIATACPSDTELCVETSHGWLSFSSPTLWGIFAMTFLVPLIYMLLMSLIISFHRKYGGLFNMSNAFPWVKKYQTYFILLLVVLGALWFSYAFVRLHEPMTPISKPVPKPIPMIDLSSLSWNTYQGNGYQLKYPSNAFVSSSSDSMEINLRPTLGIYPNFMDEWGDYSSISDFSLKIFVVALKDTDPRTAKDFLQMHGKRLNLSEASWCRPSVFAQVEACYVQDQTYGYPDLQAYLRYHYYFINQGNFYHVTAIASLQDLSKGTMIDRRNYRYLLQYTPIINEMIRSFTFHSLP